MNGKVKKALSRMIGFEFDNQRDNSGLRTTIVSSFMAIA